MWTWFQCSDLKSARERLFAVVVVFECLSLCFTENRIKRDVIITLVQRGYPSDPVKAWKDVQKSNGPEGDTDDASSVASSASSAGGPDFNYLLSMSLLSLSREKKEELLKERDNKVSYTLITLCRSQIQE